MNSEEFELLGEPRMTMAQFTLEEQFYNLEESDEPQDVKPSTNMHLAETPRDTHYRFVSISRHDSGTVNVYIGEWERTSGERICLRSHGYNRVSEWSVGRLVGSLHLDDWFDRPENVVLETKVLETFVAIDVKIEGLI